MGEVVNLRQARKARRRGEKEKLAEANRLAFGRQKAEKATRRADRDRLARFVDGHKRDSEIAG
jgi:hypothetical protein